MSFDLGEMIQAIAPSALCRECIGDRVPLSQRRLTQVMIDELNAPRFERYTGHCVGCQQTKHVVRYG